MTCTNVSVLFDIFITFRCRILEEIVNLQETRVNGLTPRLAFVISDNKEAQSLAGVKSGNTYMKCRVCKVSILQNSFILLPSPSIERCHNNLDPT